MEVRIQKYFTDCGIMSRRAAEAEILAGRVTVNGACATIGQKIDTERDVVIYNGRRVEPISDRHVYVMLNKPRGYVTTASDEKGRRCVTDLVADVGVRLYPVGRLDMDSDGLLLLTNDGELTNFLTHPRHSIPKIYQVYLKGRISPEKLATLGEGININGKMTRKADVRLIGLDNTSTLVEITLFEGRNRQIRRMCEDKGLDIVRLSRVAIGKVKLGNLAPGKWRKLNGDEVRYFRNAMKREEKDNA